MRILLFVSILGNSFAVNERRLGRNAISGCITIIERWRPSCRIVSGRWSPFFSAVICGCNAGLFREALHEVYIPRIQRGNAYFAANVLGAREPLLSVLVHFFEQGRWGSPVQVGVKAQSLTAEDQLFILMQAGSYLTATRGLGAAEARICYERAEPLCHSLGCPLLLYVALIGQWRYTLHADKLTATMQIAERIHSLAQEQNDSALIIGAYRALAVTLFYLGDFESARQYAMCGLQIWRSGISYGRAPRARRSLSVLYRPMRVALGSDRLLPSDHSGSDLTSKGAE